MNIYIFSFTKQATLLSSKLQNQLTKSLNLEKCDFSCTSFAPKKYIIDTCITPLDDKLQNVVGKCFKKGNILIFISACGIAVRSIAPFIEKKTSDPCVIVIDELGKFVISLLSGHIGRGNEFTLKISNILNSTPIISTATDLNNLFAVDLFAKKNNLVISDMEIAKKISADLLNSLKIGISGNIPKGDIPKNIFPVYSTSDVEELNITTGISISSFKNQKMFMHTLHLIPKQVVLGIGCKKNTEPQKLEDFISEILETNNIFPDSIAAITSIDLKSQEKAIIELSKKYQVPFITYNAEALLKIKGNFTTSSFVKKITGVDNVCERSTMACSKAKELFLRKTAKNGMTVAISLLNLSYEF